MLAINRNAIWSAVADILEAKPERYQFWASFIPEEGKCGCLFGIAGELLGMEPGIHVREVAKAMGTSESEFYTDMTYVLMNSDMPNINWRVSNSDRPNINWHVSSLIAVKGLRLIASREVTA